MNRRVPQQALLAPQLLPRAAIEHIAEHALLLAQFASECAADVLDAVQAVVRASPWRHMLTPGGQRMSVAMSNCGRVGWVSDRHGYRYQATDPVSGQPWPQLPERLRTLACTAAAAAGFDGFAPDACLINRYEPGTRLSAHQDRNERDLSAPVVSVSLGLPATFLFGGSTRAQRMLRVPLYHGDVVVWGHEQRLAYHAVAALADGEHPATGRCRINLTLRKAL